MKKILTIITAFSLIFITGCGTEEVTYITEGNIEDMEFKETEEITNYIKIEMENDDIIIAQLYPEVAPITVANMQKLIDEKFYDGIIFHRVIENFMIQTGDPLGNGTGGSDENIKGEFELNGIENNLSHERGVLSMARRGGNPDTAETMDSASSQFFIVHQDATSLDGLYASFGKVIAGMDVVDKIASTPVNGNDLPNLVQKIKTIRFVEIEK